VTRSVNELAKTTTKALAGRGPVEGRIVRCAGAHAYLWGDRTSAGRPFNLSAGGPTRVVPASVGRSCKRSPARSGAERASRGMKMPFEGSVRSGPNVWFIRDRGLHGRTQTGRPFSAMGFEPVLFIRPPLRLAWIERPSSYRSVSFFRWFSHTLCQPPCRGGEASGVGQMGGSRDRPGCAPRFLCGRDLRGREGPLRGAGAEHPDGLRALTESLLPTDRVALEVTGSCWEVARILEPHVNRVIVVSPDDTGISSARAKTDKSAWTAAHPGAMKCFA
jgi:hypothetical protein